MTVEFRDMLPADLPRVLELETAIYPQPWSPLVFTEELSQANRVYLVAVDDDDTVVGYAGLMVVAADAHITTVAVDPVARGNRLGTRLMLALADAAVEAGAEHLTLEVRMSNEAAQRLYERFGFAPVGLRKNYYRDEDALVMWAIDIGTAEYRERLESIREGLS